MPIFCWLCSYLFDRFISRCFYSSLKLVLRCLEALPHLNRICCSIQNYRIESKLQVMQFCYIYWGKEIHTFFEWLTHTFLHFFVPIILYSSCCTVYSWADILADSPFRTYVKLIIKWMYFPYNVIMAKLSHIAVLKRVLFVTLLKQDSILVQSLNESIEISDVQLKLLSQLH
jgi:hypothetical protein